MVATFATVAKISQPSDSSLTMLQEIEIERFFTMEKK
jgi:hypothetical protein